MTARPKTVNVTLDTPLPEKTTTCLDCPKRWPTWSDEKAVAHVRATGHRVEVRIVQRHIWRPE